jgi:hypothetical protein
MFFKLEICGLPQEAGIDKTRNVLAHQLVRRSVGSTGQSINSEILPPKNR